jgi:hypothetical protein
VTIIIRADGITFSGSPFVFGTLPEEYRSSKVKIIPINTASTVVQIEPVTGKIVSYTGGNSSTIYGQCTYSV